MIETTMKSDSARKDLEVRRARAEVRADQAIRENRERDARETRALFAAARRS